ncbi:Rha family transcriptional regulator [Propionivibrio sp.]|uniref:Rha family transcriptional regulator n=1 Tax=Propionivibrio sp. TaxID=2212460 RepID=UPI003BF0360E
MNALTLPSMNTLTMTSREIAELTGKEHKNVMADIRKMLVELHGEGGVLSFQHTHTNSQNGQTYPVFNLPKRESLILVSGYNVAMRAKIIDRWQELEARSTLPVELSRMQLINMAMEAEQERLILVEQKAVVDEKLAIAAPKAEALDRISASSGSMTMTEVAKVVGIKRKDLTARMQAEGLVYRQNGSIVAYDKHIKNGNLEYKEAKYTDDKSGLEVRKPYCHVTPKGMALLAMIFNPIRGLFA